MPRSVYHQSAGNPVQLDRLPTSKPELHFAAKALSFSEQTMTIGKCWGLLLLGTVCVWSMQPNGVFRSELGLLTVILFFGANFVMLKGAATANPSWAKGQSALYTIAFFFVAGFAVSVAHPLLAAFGLGAFVWLFGMHAVDLATTAPMSPIVAKRIRYGAASYFAVMAFVPAALSLLPMPHRAVGVVAMAGVAALTALLDGGGSSFGCLLTSWRDWLTYNRYGSQAPGLRETIAGSWRIRFALLSGCLLLLVASGVKHSTEPLPLTPLGLVLFAPPLLAWPALMRVRASQKATTPDNRWSRLVGSLQESTDQIERESVYFGQVVSDGSPVIVPREVFREHAHFLGDSGSGKTSLGLSPLVEQLIRFGDSSVVIIDLKADSLELLASLQAAAAEVKQRTGRDIPIKQFSAQPSLGTFGFNPLQQPFWPELELYQKTDVLCGALGLIYGTDYGEGYYSAANAAVLYRTLQRFPEVRTLRELSERLSWFVNNAKKKELSSDLRTSGSHVEMELECLADFAALNVVADDPQLTDAANQAIDLSQLFEQPQILYFHLSATLSPSAAPKIARLLTYSLMCAATQARERKQVYLVIDEFQRMVAHNIEYMLQLARSMNIGVILANQSMQDLKTSGTNLIPAIEANCRLRQWFSVSAAEDRKRISENSGVTVEEFYATSYRSEETSLSVSQQILP
ncbi:MAG: type IV secretory system conjugative DNA transfer family protein [Planctomycetaceae bacterium]